jgi:hypothetical protein
MLCNLLQAAAEGATLGVIFLAVDLLSKPQGASINWSSKPVLGAVPQLADLLNSLPRTHLLLMLLGLAVQGRTVRRTVYRRQPWTRGDGLVLVAAAVTVGVYALPASRGSLAWSPYPQLTWPGVDLAIVLATLGLLAPAALLAWSRSEAFGRG